MTTKELSQLYWLKREIEWDKQRLEILEDRATSPETQKLDGMPHATSYEDTLSRRVAEIMDLKATINTKQQRCIYERNRLERYIANIPDSLTRQIFTLHYAEGLNWVQTAAKIGGGNTDEAVRKRVYRYIKSMEE